MPTRGEAAGEVTGEVLLPAGAPRGVARLRVTVEDVTLLDAPSRVVGVQVQEAVACEPGRRLPFTVPAGRLDPARRYVVRVHVGRSDAAGVRAGDLVSTQSHRVPATGPLVVPVTVVAGPVEG